jgi:hypothetical protein
VTLSNAIESLTIGERINHGHGCKQRMQTSNIKMLVGKVPHLIFFSHYSDALYLLFDENPA